MEHVSSIVQIMEGTFEGFHEATEGTAEKTCNKTKCKIGLDNFDNHSKCVMHRSCISRSSLSYADDASSKNTILDKESNSCGSDKSSESMADIKSENTRDSMISNASKTLSERSGPIELAAKREIKILPKPAIGLSIGNIITNGPGKPVQNTYLIVTNLPPPPQPSLHIEVPPGKRKTQYNCPECTMIFTNKANLNNHLKKEHKKKKLFHCEFCNKDFCRKHVLESHIKTKHDKQKYHKCPKCDEEFHLKKLLNVHIENEHRKDKFFNCPECGMEFNLRNTMMNHYKSMHRKAKSFQCDHCDARYSWKKSLNIHIDSTHKNLQQFKCDQCTSVFRWKASLANHYKVVHKVERMMQFTCEDCASIFKTQKRFISHRKKVHKDTSIDMPSECIKSLKSTEQDNLNNKSIDENIQKQLPPQQPMYAGGTNSNLPLQCHLIQNMHHNEMPMPAHSQENMPMPAHRHNEMLIHNKHINMPMPAHNYNTLPVSVPMPLPYVPYNPYYNH